MGLLILRATVASLALFAVACLIGFAAAWVVATREKKRIQEARTPADDII
jgi:hypothetical protein